MKNFAIFRNFCHKIRFFENSFSSSKNSKRYSITMLHGKESRIFRRIQFVFFLFFQKNHENFDKILKNPEPKNLELYLKSPIKRTTRLALTNFFHSQNSASNLFTIFEVFPKQSKNEVNQFIVNELLQTIANYDKKSQTWILKPKPLSKFEAKFPDFCLQQEKNWKVLVQQNENALKTRFKVLGYSVVTNVLSTNSETFKPNAQTSEVSADAPTNMQTAQQIEQKNMINALKLFLVQAFNKLGVCSYDLLWNAFKAHQAKNQNVSGLKNIKEALFKQALGLMGQTFGGKNDVYVLKGRKKEEEEFRKPILELFSTFPESLENFFFFFAFFF